MHPPVLNQHKILKQMRFTMYATDSIVRTAVLNENSNIFKYADFSMSDNKIMNIMIIDDNKKDIDLFEELLSVESNLKFNLSKYTNSHEAIVLLEHKQISTPDLIVLDLVMPTTNGHMILKRLKEVSSLQSIPVAIHSSMSNYENTLKSHNLEAHAFFSKPLNVEMFEAFILGKNI
jgi:response regulator RpfG family c-di-GMP phosphodiesterase